MKLFSSVLCQLAHLSISLEQETDVIDPWIVSGDVLDRTCLARLNDSATYSLQLLCCISYDEKEKKTWKSFLRLPRLRRRPKVLIQETNHFDVYVRRHSFVVYTLPSRKGEFSSYFLSRSSQLYVQNISILRVV